MPGFTPITPLSTGVFTPQSIEGLIDSTYDTLGGAYESINYLYDGSYHPFISRPSPVIGTFAPS